QLQDEIPLPDGSTRAPQTSLTPPGADAPSETPLPAATWGGGAIVTPPGAPTATPAEVAAQPSPSPAPSLTFTPFPPAPTLTPEGPFGPIVGPGHTLVPTTAPAPVPTF